MMESSAMGTNGRICLQRRRLRTPKPKVSVPVRSSLLLPRRGSYSYQMANLTLGPVCKRMNDIRPNTIFLSSAFEPSHEELRTFARVERERSRLVQERKLVKQKRKPPPPKSKLAVQVKPEIIDLSSDEELPDFSQILAGKKREGAPCAVFASECED